MSLWKNWYMTGEMVNNPLSTENYSYLGAGVPCERKCLLLVSTKNSAIIFGRDKQQVET